MTKNLGNKRKNTDETFSVDGKTIFIFFDGSKYIMEIKFVFLKKWERFA